MSWCNNAGHRRAARTASRRSCGRRNATLGRVPSGTNGAVAAQGHRGNSILETELAAAADFRAELRHFLYRTDSVAAQAGLTTQRYDLLLMIKSAGELRVTELCNRLHLQQSAVTELVKRTEEAGLIARRSSREDGRVWLLRLTAKGDRLLMRAFSALHDDRKAVAAAFRELDKRFRATAHPSG
jgi:DNA-binding MarR family transcriptional regulator